MAEPRNRVVQVRRFGGPDGLEVVDAPLPVAGRGEGRVRVLASSVVYTDVVIRRHLYPQTISLQPPFVLGYDVVGEIDQLGQGVTSFELGDRVADMTVVGSNVAYRTLRAGDLTRVPAGGGAAEGATFILSWTTAYQLLHRAAHVQRGQRVLVHGAAGAVGQALSRLAGWPGSSYGARRAAVTPRWCANWAARRSTTSGKTSRTCCQADSISSSPESKRTAVAAPWRRSSAAACSALMDTRRAGRRTVACRPSLDGRRACICWGGCLAASAYTSTRS